MSKSGRRLSESRRLSEKLISTERRRLTAGDPEKDINYDAEVANASLSRPETNRGLIDFLGVKGLLESATFSTHVEPRRGSFTMSGDTKMGEKSFDEKRCVSEADTDTNVSLEMVRDVGVGISCKKGCKPEAPNQDSYCYVHAVGEDGFDLYGVFDGHGVCGHEVSNYVRGSLPKLFLSDPLRNVNTREAMLNSFGSCQRLLEEDTQVDCSISGSTGTLVYRKRDSDEITVAHCGDSRAVLVYESKGKAVGIEVTKDHKPILPAEKRRIEENGGCVVFDGFYNHRVFKKGTAYPGLNMSRTFGDSVGQHEAGIIATPDVKTVNIKAKYNFLALVLCSDGVWEFIDSNEAAKIVLSTRNGNKGKIDPIIASEMLAKEAWNRWMEDTAGDTSDDITILMQVF